MRILFIGDMVGRSGRAAVLDALPALIARLEARSRRRQRRERRRRLRHHRGDLQEFIDAGADAVTLGNHSWDQREALVFIERAPRLIRPLNYPPGTPGRGAADRDGERRARAGHQRHGPRLHGPARRSVRRDRARARACPLASARRRHRRRHPLRGDQREAGDGPFLRRPRQPGVGTHTHVPTADHQILPGGTAFMTDVGMTGDYDSVIGMDKDEPLHRFVRRISLRQVRAGAGLRRCARSRSRPTMRQNSRKRVRHSGTEAAVQPRRLASNLTPLSRVIAVICSALRPSLRNPSRFCPIVR
jgi:hypothetical protein